MTPTTEVWDGFNAEPHTCNAFCEPPMHCVLGYAVSSQLVENGYRNLENSGVVIYLPPVGPVTFVGLAPAREALPYQEHARLRGWDTASGDKPAWLVYVREIEAVS